MAENHASAPGSKTEDTPTRTREELDELARQSYLHALDRQHKIETLITMDVFDMLALLRYRPDEAGSFKEIYHQHQEDIHTAILNRRFLPEWRFIAPDGATWDPLAPIPNAYRKRIVMIVYHEQMTPRDQEKQKYDLVWSGFGREGDILGRYEDVVGGGLTFLTFLQYMEDTVSSMERKIMTAWRERFSKTDAIKNTWILPWAERNLHRTLLVLWSMNLPKNAKDELVPQELDCPGKRLRQLTVDEGKLIIQLSEATAIWHLGRPDADIATEAPTKITQAGWMYRQWFLVSSDNPFGNLETFFENKNKEMQAYNS